MVDFAALGLSEAELEKQLSKTKIRLFYFAGAAFLASIMSQTKFVWDDTIPTACTNGLEIRFNPVFFMGMKPDARVTVLAHELWHIAYQHVLSDRRGDRDPQKWNIAADHVINIQLEDSKYSFEGIENCCKDRRYKNLTTEQVYARLPDPPPNGGGGGGSASSPAGLGSRDLGSGDIEELSTPEQHQEVMTKIVQAVQSAEMGKQAGSIPGEILLELDKFLNPKLPWRYLLRRFFTERANEDYSWARPNRRYDDEYLPSRISDDGLTKINYYLDISGSVSDGDITRFNSEVKHIKDEFNPKELNLITFDTRIQDVVTFTEDDPFERIIVTGRGGTDLDPVAKHIIDTQPSVAVIFSDLYVDPMPDVGEIPVIWIVVGNPYATVPFGEMVHIDNE